MATEKDSYLSHERKNNANFMRKSGNGDTLAVRKSIGRHGEATRAGAKKKELAGKISKAHDTSKRSLPHSVKHAISPSSGKDQKGYFENRDSKGKVISYGIKHD